MPVLFARMHAAQAPRITSRERSAAPMSRSNPPRGISTAETDPWMYDWLSKGSEW